VNVALKIGEAAARPIGDYGFSTVLLTLTHQGIDTLQLTIERRFEEAQLIPAFTKCVLTVDGVVRFIGWRDSQPTHISARSQTVTYMLAGPWRWLERKPYLATSRTGGGLLAASSGLVTLGAKWVVGEGATITGEKSAIREQLEEILEKAASNVAGEFISGLVEMDEEFLDWTHPNEQRIDDTPGALIRALMGFAPGTVIWWSYVEDGGEIKPCLNFGDAGEMDITQTLTVADLILTPLEPMEAQLVGKVRVIYFQDSGGTTVRSEVVKEAAGDALAANSDLERAYTFNLGSQPVPSARFADKLAEWAQRLHIAGQPVFNAITWARLPGEQWGFGGKFASLAGKRATCQSIVRDLLKDTEIVTFGPPPPPTFLSRRVEQAAKTETVSTPGGGGGGGGEEEEETGELAITMTGLPEGVVGKWAVGDRAGEGEATVELPPGEYTVAFLPAVDTANGVLHIADSKTVTIVEDGSEAVEGEYVPADLSPAWPFKIQGYMESGTPFVRVLPSYAFDSEELSIDGLSAGSGGEIWVQVPFTPSTGTIGAGTIHYGTEAPESTESNYVVRIGMWVVEAGRAIGVNWRYGPITGYACRNWFSDPAEYTLTIQ
jgi:hypothetical protein